jgi:hypothetical protein
VRSHARGPLRRVDGFDPCGNSGVELMTEKKDRDRVMAEITLEHVLRLATVTSNEELDRLLAMSPVYN